MIQSHALRLIFAASLTLAVSATLITSGFTQDKKLNSVAMSVGDLGNPFFVQIAHGAENKAKEINPQVKFNALSSNYDVNLQSNQMDNFISTKPDLIMLGAADSKGIAPAVMRAKQAGITIVALDVGADGGVDATLPSDNKQAGRLDGQYIADRLKGKGQIVILNGPPVTSIQDRVAGALEVFKKYPDIKILSRDQNTGSTRDGGLRIMSDLLTSFPKIDAVFCINDESAVGAQLAATQAKRTEFFIVGVDGSPDIVPFLKDKDSLIAATAAQDPYAMAAKGVEIGYDILQGKKPGQDPILVPVDLVTKDNVAQFKGWTK